MATHWHVARVPIRAAFPYRCSFHPCWRLLPAQLAWPIGELRHHGGLRWQLMAICCLQILITLMWICCDLCCGPLQGCLQAVACTGMTGTAVIAVGTSSGTIAAYQTVGSSDPQQIGKVEAAGTVQRVSIIHDPLEVRP